MPLPGGNQTNNMEFVNLTLQLCRVDSAASGDNLLILSGESQKLSDGTRCRTFATVCLNPNTGRFWIADTYEGEEESPESLHKYVECRSDPVNKVDASGNDVGESIDVIDIGRMLSGFALPVTGSTRFFEERGDDEEKQAHGTGFAYVLGTTTSPPWPLQQSFALNASGVQSFKNRVASIKASGKKIGYLELWGHGDVNQNLGSYTGAILAFNALFPSTQPNVLNNPDVRQVFTGCMLPNPVIDLEFCHSLDTDTIPDLFLEAAPQAEIWGTHGKAYGIGDYGNIFPWYMERYHKK
jgi:hypothetical protein